MRIELRTVFKRLLSRVLPDSSRLRYLSHLGKLETWRRQHTERYPVFSDRSSLYSYLNEEVVRGGAVTYLEFGVFQGYSIKYWSRINTHPGSRFWGFDTFEGQPGVWEAFTESLDSGAFNVAGRFPTVNDPRVGFVKGLLQDTLCQWLRDHPIKEQLIINCDLALHSATLFALTRCNDILRAGSIVLFGAFSNVLNEFHALEDYCSAYRRDYDVVAATRGSATYYSNVAIRVT